MFLYALESIEWTTGDASGGLQALAGIDNGDGLCNTIIGSRTPDIINIAKTSNVGMVGLYMFKVDRPNCKYSIRRKTYSTY